MPYIPDVLGYKPNHIVRGAILLNKEKTPFIILFTVFSGLRRTELINLSWDDINLENRYLIIIKSKNKNQRKLFDIA